MTPFEQAQAVYASEPCARTFSADLYWHLQCGIVLNTPTCFAMVRPVYHNWPASMLKDTQWCAPHGDCWMMWLAAGDIGPVFSLGPEKPFVCWEKMNIIKVTTYERFRRLYRPNAPRPAV